MPWSSGELERIDAARELQIAAIRSDGQQLRWTPIWVVCADGQVFVRSWHRRDTGWFGQAVRSGRARIRVPGLEAGVAVEDLGAGTGAQRQSVDTAYRSKYGSAAASSMVGDAAAATTLRLTPASAGTA